MTKRTIGYWLCTGMTAFAYLVGGYFDVTRPDFVIEEMTTLGYPAYFAVILGVWKILGGIAVLLPKTPLLKEWAYAGMVFNLTSATASHLAIHDTASETLLPLIILAIVAASWVLRPASRRLA